MARVPNNTCGRCGRTCVYVRDGGDGRIRHAADCLRATAAEYRSLAERARTVNTHDRPYYLRAAAEHDAAALVAATAEAGAMLATAVVAGPRRDVREVA